MKSFEVVVQQVNGVYRATVLALPQLKTEGASRDEALLRVQTAIEEFFKSAEVVRVPVDVPDDEYRPYATANDRLRFAALTPCQGDADAQCYEYIAAERRRDHEEVAREYDQEEMRQRQRERRLEEIRRRQSGLL